MKAPIEAMLMMLPLALCEHLPAEGLAAEVRALEVEAR